ncbi:MAG: sugar ABC transporter permease [Spirochaetaceae bacterium]|jgi:ABC-type sugar transport system permease subunit|nr:sugar ABC transporter permease [Spirochaetaceae bacterium]
MKKKGLSTSHLFLLPAGIIYISVVISPVFYSAFLSLFKWNGIGKMRFRGLGNYVQLFSEDPVFHKALVNNFIWIILTLVLSTLLALCLAVMLNKEFRGRTFFRGLFYLPAVIAPIAVSIIWRWIYNPEWGFINQMSKLLGSSFSQNWLSTPSLSIYAVFGTNLWQSVGQPMIFFLAGLQTVPVDCLEAATIDGASNWRRFLHVTIPLLKETFVIVIANLLIGAMKVFDIIMGLTAGGPADSTQMMSTYMQSQTFRYNNVGYGAAIAVLMVLFMLVVIVPYVRFTASRDN